MSSSTSSAPPSALGDCVVCGQESSTRCGSCLQGGVNWMFFCSREHQKLIWSVHKRVCGGHFKWPVLKPQEMEEMLEFSTRSMRVPQRGNFSWLEAFGKYEFESFMSKEKGYTSPEDLFKAIVSALGSEESSSLNTQDLSARFRAGSYNVQINTEIFAGVGFRYRDLYALMASKPLHFLAYSELTYLWNTTGTDYAHTSWYSDFQHRMVCLVGVFIVYTGAKQFMDQPDKLKDVMQAWGHVLNQIKKLARETIRSTHPNAARIIVEVLIPSMLKHAGTVLREIGHSDSVWPKIDNDYMLKDMFFELTQPERAL